MYNELVTTMQTEHCSLSQADFFGENVFNKPIPVPVLESAQALVRNDDSDIYNLDQELSQPQDESFYQNEDTSYGTKRQCARNIYQCKNGVYEQITVKQEPLNSESQQFSNEEQYHFWNMQSKILSECVQDVRDTCRRLCICPDPTRWSCVQVQQWIDWQCLQFRLQMPHMEGFFMPGSQLCNLTEEHFRMFAPEAGSALYSRLDIWRSVVEQTTFNGCANNIFQLTQIPTPTSSPSLGSVSPSPSVWSEESQPSSSPKQLHQIVRSTAVTEEDSDRLPEEPIHHHRQTIQLWQFLKLLLLDGNYSDCIRWVDKPRGIFKIENSSRVAKLWGKRKNRPAMNYDKLSRSIRQYYKKNIIKKTEHSKRLVYQFCHL